MGVGLRGHWGLRTLQDGCRSKGTLGSEDPAGWV